MKSRRVISLADCLSLVIDYRGKTPKKLGREWSTSGYRALSARNVKTGEIVQPDNVNYADEDLYLAWMKDEIERGDILVTSEAPFGQIFLWDSDEKIILSQRLFAIRPRKTVCDSHYLFYWMCSHHFQSEMQSRATGTTVIGLRQPELLKCTVELPDMCTQLKISQVLKDIDSQICNLRQTNDYLHDILLNSYRNKFFNSHALPNGTIEDLGEVVGGATPSKKNGSYYSDDGIAWITPRDLANSSNIFISHGEMDISAEGYSTCSTNLMPRGSVLFSSRAPVGYVAIASNDVCTNQGFKSLVPRDDVGTAYAYCFLKENASAIENAGSGTTFIEVSGKVMREFPVVVPDKDECRRFSQYAAPLFEMIENNEDEKRHLEKLRDTLLPKLLSGEIDVSKVDITQPNNHLPLC